MGKAFASPRRLELLDLLAQAPRTVDELARASEQSTANTSQHLQALHAAGMVTRAREGTSVRYALAGDEVLALWLALRDASRRAAGRGRARRARLPRRGRRGDRPRRADRAAAQGRRRAGRRPPAPRSSRPGTSTGARSIPLDELEERLGRAARRPRGRRLLPRPVLRLRARGRAPPAGGGPPGAAPGGRLARMAARGQAHEPATRAA